MNNKAQNRLEEVGNQFMDYHEKHPEVYEHFKRFTFELINAGYPNGSVAMIIERIRWESKVNNIDQRKEFKIGNNFKPWYGRMFMLDYPEHKGFFRIRTMFSKDRPPTGKEFGPQDVIK